MLENFKDSIQNRAQGIFLWAVLVVRILNREHDRGANVIELRRRLSEIPSGLHELFRDILRSGMRDDEHLVHVLQWILYARQPMTPEELYFAVQSGTTNSPSLEPWNRYNIGSQNIDLFILNSSKGLAEMTKVTKRQKPMVQFIHESVRDYLRSTGLSALAPALAENLEGFSHDYLKNCCLTSISHKILAHLSLPEPLPKAKSEEAKDLRKRASDLFPFLEYAVKTLIHHAELACGGGIGQIAFIERLPLDAWRVLSDLFAIYDTRRCSPFTTVASILVRDGACKLFLEIGYEQHAGPCFLQEYEEVLRAAVAGGNAEIIAILLKICPSTALSENAEERIFCQATSSRDTTILAMLLENRARANAVPFLLSIATAAFKANNIEALQMLSRLDKGIAVCGSEALFRATDRGSKVLVRAYCELGVDVNKTVEGKYHPLYRASQLGHLEIVRILLSNGADANLSDMEPNPLLAACLFGHEDIVRLLLEHGAPVNCAALGDDVNLPGRVWSPLILACRWGFDSIARLLLEHGAQVNGSTLTSQTQTPLQEACKQGNVSIVQILLDWGADVKLANDGGMTPLGLAYAGGHTAIVRVLLDSGARFYQVALCNPTVSGNVSSVGLNRTV